MVGAIRLNGDNRIAGTAWLMESKDNEWRAWILKLKCRLVGFAADAVTSSVNVTSKIERSVSPSNLLSNR